MQLNLSILDSASNPCAVRINHHNKANNLMYLQLKYHGTNFYDFKQF